MVNTVKLYIGTLEIDGERFCCEIPAKSWLAAEAIFRAIGAVLDGELIEEMPLGMICAVCKGDVVVNKTNPEPVESEWPEDIL